MYTIQNGSGSKHLGVSSRLNCVFNGSWYLSMCKAILFGL